MFLDMEYMEDLMEGSVVLDGSKLETELSKFENLSDDDLKKLSFSFPWQFDSTSTIDPDFKDRGQSYFLDKEIVNLNRAELQQACWNKSIENPQINTSVRGSVGRINGYDFAVTSSIKEIQDVIDEIELDPRNRLYLYYPKYTARALIEGELFLCFTCHEDGFVEIDFIDPSTVMGGEDDGIIFHPRKAVLPLIYIIDSGGVKQQIPSIFLARYPEWISDAKTAQSYDENALNGSRSSSGKFKALGGFNRFIVSWDRSFITKRNVSHLRTTIKWLEYYENLKEYEIDHKKSSGAYIWIVKITDPKTFRMWLSLTNEQRRLTGIGAKKTPGSTMVLPPGMEMMAINPNLPKISDTDTDVLSMAISGLNEPSDITMGTSQSTYASVKASRGPMSDRISDEICFYEKFLRHDFWGGVFFLKSKLVRFPVAFKVREAVGFKPSKDIEDPENDATPIFAMVKRTPERLIEVNFPTSEVIDAESRARAFLGVKHGSTFDTLGIPNKEIAKKLGFGNYRKLRLEHATEQSNYPQLIPTIDQETVQEQREAEPSPSKVRKLPKGEADAKKTKGKKADSNE
jgi:hypothetical protein